MIYDDLPIYLLKKCDLPRATLNNHRVHMEIQISIDMIYRNIDVLSTSICRYYFIYRYYISRLVDLR